MPEEILIDDIKFWKEDEIIYCKIYSIVDSNKNPKNLEDIFAFAIRNLSDENYLPLLINMRELGYTHSFKSFKFLAKNRQIKAMVLSKTFLVNSYWSKFILVLYNLTFQPVTLNAIYKNQQLAKNDCIRNYRMFNPLSLK